MKLYGVLNNEKNGREARKGSDKKLLLNLTLRGKPAYNVLMTPEAIMVRDEQNGKILLDVKHGKGKTKNGYKCPDCGSDIDDEYQCCSNKNCDYFK